jgi:hypothetical protein
VSARCRRVGAKARTRLRTIVALGLLAIASVASAAGPVALPVDAVAEAYVHPQRLVEVEPGRRMHLLCMGEGAPTVVFDAGLSDGASTWALIQPRIAGPRRCPRAARCAGSRCRGTTSRSTRRRR